MPYITFYIALGLYLIASGGFIIYMIRQHDQAFYIAYRVLIGGFVFHTFFFAHRFYLMGVAPILGFKAALSFFSWVIVLSYLVFHQRFKVRILASFAVPFSAFLMIVSSAMPWFEGPIKPIFKSIWLVIHVVTVFVGNGLFAIAFMAAVMYLIQERQIKQKKLGAFFKRLPSLASLDSISHYSLVYGFPFLTAGMITGSIYAQLAFGKYWQWDPKEVWTLITWLFYAVLLHERLAAGWRGRKAAIMSIVCFALLLFTLVGANFLMEGYHSFDSLGVRQAV